MRITRLEGLIAATYTPFDDDERMNLSMVAPMVERLLADGVSGLFVCGSTGEGVSLTGQERREAAQAYVAAAAGRVPVIVQVGHNSLTEARQLAEHAASIGADAVSAVAPSYFHIGSVGTLVGCMAKIAAGAPGLPFYYYHIPAMTGVAVDMAAFLQRGGQRIANLAGLKFTDSRLDQFQACVALDGGRFDVTWGYDEMLLSALAAGARGAVGSTYNIAAPIYRRVIDAFDAGDMAAARAAQLQAVRLVQVLLRYPLHPAIKHVLSQRGLDCGPCRLPLPRLTGEQGAQLERDLAAIGFGVD